MSPPSRPPFSDLPLDKNGPPGNAWGLYGKDDELGALNLITPATVKAAAQEIQTGERVSLDWNLNLPAYPSFGRPSFGWKMENRTQPDGTPRTVNDDHLDINTQSSSQWDGFRHYGYQKAKRYYGGRTQQDVEGSEVIGIDRIAHAGGITARGIILDYPRWLEKKGNEKVSALAANNINAATLKEMLKDTGVTPREGDLLLLRTGFTRDYEALGEDEKKALANKPPTFLGVESTKDVVQLIWESGFVAVGEYSCVVFPNLLAPFHTHFLSVSLTSPSSLRRTLLRNVAPRRPPQQSRRHLERRKLGGRDARRWSSAPVATRRLGRYDWRDVGFRTAL